MNNSTLFFGIAFIAYGLFSAIMRFVKPSFFKKLEPMKKRWGDKAGNAIHFIAYIIVPLAAGGFFIYAGMHGIKIF